MSIGVQSFPELYTTLIGWDLYDQLWDLLRQTGLAFAPFIVMVFRNIARPYESQETKDAVSTSLRRMEIDFLFTIFIIYVGVVPFMHFNPSMVSYTPICQNGGSSTYYAGDTQTTWDTAFSVPTDDIRIPVFWDAVLSIAEGFTSAADTMVACPVNFRKMVTDHTSIQSGVYNHLPSRR